MNVPPSPSLTQAQTIHNNSPIPLFPNHPKIAQSPKGEGGIFAQLTATIPPFPHTFECFFFWQPVGRTASPLPLLHPNLIQSTFKCPSYHSPLLPTAFFYFWIGRPTLRRHCATGCRKYSPFSLQNVFGTKGK
jgi:hypothetical protein